MCALLPDSFEKQITHEKQSHERTMDDERTENEKRKLIQEEKDCKLALDVVVQRTRTMYTTVKYYYCGPY